MADRVLSSFNERWSPLMTAASRTETEPPASMVMVYPDGFEVREGGERSQRLGVLGIELENLLNSAAAVVAAATFSGVSTSAYSS
ncbi:MAG TPA: hypothetical protein VN428_00800 [Bryobacteraceae bacterium]|nr:hypothetical protein [Bryobacteraceae bacterium]